MKIYDVCEGDKMTTMKLCTIVHVIYVGVIVILILINKFF